MEFLSFLCTKWMKNCEVMTSSTHSFAYSCWCFQKCVIKICKPSNRAESSRLFFKPEPAGVAPVGARRTAGKRVWYCDLEDTAISVSKYGLGCGTKTGWCFTACLVCVTAAIKIKVWWKRFWKCMSISYEHTVKDKWVFSSLPLTLRCIV